MSELEVLYEILKWIKFLAWVVSVSIICFLAWHLAKLIVIRPVKYWISKAFNNIF